MSDPADLGVVHAAAALARGELSSRELTAACLTRIREHDGTHSHDGDSGSINAWVRVYEDDALVAAARADKRLGAGDAPALCGIPIGLKDLYAVAGKPLTASSRLLDETPVTDCDVWSTLSAQGMVLLGHLHTHEFAAGGTTDQVGNPWALDRTAGGSSGGSAAALAARMTPAATGTDTAGSLRIPSAACGTSTIKPTRGLLSLRGIVPLAPSLDHPGPMARTLDDCALLLAGMANWQTPSSPADLVGLRFAISPRVALVDLEPDVAEAFDEVVALVQNLGAVIVQPPQVELDVAKDFLDVLQADLLVYHHRFDGRRELYRPALREWVEGAEQHAITAEQYAATQAGRAALAQSWRHWHTRERVTALLEPTLPCVAPLRGDGYQHAGTDVALISLTHYWDWTGAPVVALPAGLGRRSGLPVGVSLIGAADGDRELLAVGSELQRSLGVPGCPL